MAQAVAISSPAKINLFLAVTGRRPDGFHDLVSVAAPLEFGDELEAWSVEPGAEERGRKAESGGQKLEVRGQKEEGSEPRATDGGQFSLECDDPAVPRDRSNLILQAAEAFAAATAWRQKVHFKLTKRIPMGAGLGGGSSNAVAALRALNQLAGGVLPEAQLAAVAATLGSDCALFVANGPVIMRGRGERVEALPAAAARRLRGRRVLLFKPGFSVSTPWAYGRMAAAAPASYLPAAAAEEKLAAWLGGSGPAGELLFNNLEGVVFGKYVALPVLLEKLRSALGVAARMSGSGSCCYALPGETAAGADVVTQMQPMISAAWGPAAFRQETTLK